AARYCGQRQSTGVGLPDRQPPPQVPTSKGTQGGTAMWRRLAALTVTPLLTGAAGISAQIYAPQTLERYFRLEWQGTHGRKGAAIDGYVYKDGMQTADRLPLQIDRLGASGRVVGNSTVWVLGGVPKGGRAYFGASVPEATSYRVQVLSFDWIGGGGSGGGMYPSAHRARRRRSAAGRSYRATHGTCRRQLASPRPER